MRLALKDRANGIVLYDIEGEDYEERNWWHDFDWSCVRVDISDVAAY